MGLLRHLRHLLRGRWFRRLYAVRVVSQFGDGLFQVTLASYVIFSPERAPTPMAIAGALAAVLLPYSVLGPFVGVFLDRWSRRQVLVWSNAARVGLVAVLAAGVAAGAYGPALFGLILLCLSVNRFLLAALSASLPRVVAAEDLVTANAVTPTSGTAASVVGVAAGSSVVALAGRAGWDGDAVALMTSAVVYAGAVWLALRIPRAMLGPGPDRAAVALHHAVGDVARGLVAGLRHLGDRPAAAYGLGVIGVHRFLFGVVTVMLVLLYRNHFHSPAELEEAFAGLAIMVLVSGSGFVTAAVVTPMATERLPLRTWVVALLVLAGFTQLMPGALFTEPAMLVAAYFLGVTSQGVKISVDTLVQAHVADRFRGRVFSIYDVVFNAAFVAAAAVAALVLPESGRSHPVLAGVALCYFLSAAGYAWAARSTGEAVPRASAARSG